MENIYKLYYLKLLMNCYDGYKELNEYKNSFCLNNENFLYSKIQIGDMDDNLYKNVDIWRDFLINKDEITKNNIPKDRISTSNQTYDNWNLFQKKEEKQDNLEPELYTSSKILDIFNKESNRKIFNKSFRQLNFQKDIEGDLLTKKKRKRTNLESENLTLLNNDKNIENKEISQKRGRKTHKVKKSEVHDKMSPDNIIKKIKTKLFKSCFYFLNNILDVSYKTNEKNEIEILKLNNNITNKIKKEKEIELLDMSLKDIFSKEISTKYKKKIYSNNYNEKTIKKILANNPDETVLFSFNITLRDYLDIFSSKKTIQEIANKYDYINYNNVDFVKIEKSFVGLDKFLHILSKNNDEDYINNFILYLKNYEKWFKSKKGRKRKEKEKEFL